MIFNYDMRFRQSTYDFFNWLTHVRLLGATEIVFRDWDIVSRKWSVDEARNRYHNYIRPGPALAGLPARSGADGEARLGSHQLPDLLADLRRIGGDLPRLRSVLPPADAKYTVTLRQTFHNVHKNSDADLWTRFAERIGARVIPDHIVKPISLYDRVALYAGARMNFGVPNGPMALLYYTGYPFTIVCDPATTAKGFGGHDIAVGSQVPWFLPTQRFVWEKATMEVLTRCHEQMEMTA